MNMNPRISAILAFILMLGLAAACAPAVTPPTSTETPVPASATVAPSQPTLTATTAVTDTPTVMVTETPTAAPSPTDQAVCTNQGAFVADVTVPDNTNFKPADTFTKTWRITNTGTCTWNERYLLVYLKGDQMSAPGSLPLSETLPGASINISVNMIAPTQDGAFQGVYQFQSPDGKRFALKGGNLWVRIVVGSGTAPAPSQTPTLPASLTPAPAGSSASVTPAGNSTAITPTGSATVAATKSGVSGTCNYTESPDFETQTLALINAARATNGLPAFALNIKLSSASLTHSIDMACNSLLSHTGSDGSSPAARVAAAGYSAASIQEGIYAQPPQYGGTPASAVDWWLNDPTHRAILLNTGLTEIGVGYVSVAASALGGYFTIDVAKP